MQRAEDWTFMIIKGFGGLMRLFLYICIIMLQYKHSYNHSLITYAEALLYIFIAAGSVHGQTSLGCQAEIRTRSPYF